MKYDNGLQSTRIEHVRDDIKRKKAHRHQLLEESESFREKASNAERNKAAIEQEREKYKSDFKKIQQIAGNLNLIRRKISTLKSQMGELSTGRRSSPQDYAKGMGSLCSVFRQFQVRWTTQRYLISF